MLAANTHHIQTEGLQIGNWQLKLQLYHFTSHHFQHLRITFRSFWLPLDVQLEMEQKKEKFCFSSLIKHSKGLICIKTTFHWWIKREYLNTKPIQLEQLIPAMESDSICTHIITWEIIIVRPSALHSIRKPTAQGICQEWFICVQGSLSMCHCLVSAMDSPKPYLISCHLKRT